MRAKHFITEYTKDAQWQDWTIRHEFGKKKGEPVRWMAFHNKRGPNDAHKGQSDSVESAIEDAKAWIQSGGNQKKQFGTAVTIDFNVRFVNDILNGGEEFFAKIVEGPKLIISDEQGPGMKRSHIRNITSKTTDTGMSTPLPLINISANDAESAGLVPHGRYILGDTTKTKDGNLEFPLIYQSTVHSTGDKWRLSKPGLTVATNRDLT